MDAKAQKETPLAGRRPGDAIAGVVDSAIVLMTERAVKMRYTSGVALLETATVV